jgi:hypothetical protein
MAAASRSHSSSAGAAGRPSTRAPWRAPRLRLLDGPSANHGGRRLRRFAQLLASLAVAGTLAAQPPDGTDASPADPGDPAEAEKAAAEEAAASIDAAALAARGARIGNVNIEIENVFDTSNSAEDKRLYRWANRVHVRTRPAVVDDILLFETGDDLEVRVLEESARLLRARGFVAEATVRPGSYDEATNTAAIDVWMRDAWSLEPELKLSRSGGENEYAIGLSEENLFGLGKSLTVSRSSDVDRDETFFGYSDPNVMGGRSTLDLVLADTSDGHRVGIAAGRPFYALDSRWSVGGNTLDEERVDSIYDLGEVIDEFRRDTTAFTIQGGLSRGIVDGVSVRWLGGMSYEELEFQTTDATPVPLLLPEDRKLVYPWVGLQIVADDFRQMTELNDIGRTEDVALGLNLFMSVGFANERFGADRRATLFNLTARRGWEPGGPGHLFQIQASGFARNEADGIHNSVVTFGGRYYHRNFGNQLFSASLSVVLANRLDAESQVLLGGDNGLRGYPLRYQSGERSSVLTLEQRFFTDWYPFRLLRVGYAFFLDAGRVSGEDPRGTPNLGTLYDLGIGLRLTSPRSSGRSVVHIDLAFPLNGDDSIDDVQLIIEKKGSF